MMKNLMFFGLMVSSMISVDSFAGEAPVPTVCQKEAYCHDCCIAVNTKIQQEAREKNAYPEETIKVDSAKQAQ